MSHSSHAAVKPKLYKPLVALCVLIVALVGALAYGTLTTHKNRFTPDLALDLEGGTQIILTPVATDGRDVTADDVSQAIEIIRQRVDASGVAEAEINSQGGSNIVVGLPGNPSKETLNLVRTSAVLRMRPVLAIMQSQKLDAAAIAQAMKTAGKKLVAGTDKAMTPEDIKKNIAALADINGDGKISDAPEKKPADPSDTAWITEKTTQDMYLLECGSQAAQLAATGDDPKKALVACDATGTTKYILGPAEVEGGQITQATSGPALNAQGTPSGGYAVNMEFNSEGSKAFADSTARISQLQSPRNQFSIVLDGKVLSAPVPSGRISGGAQITGSFTAPEAAALANQLSFGSLPLNFQVQSEEQISATLGTDQLQSGLIAGLIGLLIIVAYMVWQYHALGVVSVISILLSTGLSYFVISLLSWAMGYRLSMAGVLGMIVSIGVTADSFIVYFERIRDEIRDGRTVPGAIQHGWLRARRTIIVSDAVNLLASIVLYILTVGSVRGFAFTLGITTVLDLIVVMMFTYPLMHYLGRTKFFGEGKPYSGLNTAKLEGPALYQGRGRVRSFEPKKKARAGVTGLEDRALSADEYPDERFVSDHSTAKKTSRLERRDGESLAQLRARERRQQRQAAKGEN
ncbi:preprotein translocase subunit SecD [Arcanobacterium wilhelmae]|uniref:Protein translocase subunit SecD n=1 Tax=Arcanobacterium wilhelmae TaxID=1803177 RepID=A0ABT9NA18_9ACTO|nr:protein translocase subunit SecD [Arcanobacterium wilhelmae]MDP9800061.1 preprotein translocase subunit SecD [Arcanobacterium wilhelmae]WFN89556.1 protein translocase subunit SecD [Arcanobacterium wilhelmae]